MVTHTIYPRNWMVAMLNPNSPIPLYHQLADLLANAIQDGRYEPGERIPSEHALASHYAIGRPTVRQATDLLMRKGLVERRRGAGTFVRQPEASVDLLSLAGTTAAFEKQGLAVHTTLLAPPSRQCIVDQTENPFNNGEAIVIERLCQVTGEPVLLETLYMSPTHFPNIERTDLTDRSISRIVETHYFMTPTGGRQSFRISLALGDIAAHLGLANGTPVLCVHRTLDFDQASSAVYAELMCRTDRFAFSQTIKGNQNG